MSLKFDLRKTKATTPTAPPTTTMKSDVITCKVTLRHWHVIYTPFGSRECWQGSSEGTGTRMRQGSSAAFQSTPAGKRERTMEMIYSDSNHEPDSESLVGAPTQLCGLETIRSHGARKPSHCWAEWAQHGILRLHISVLFK